MSSWSIPTFGKRCLSVIGGGKQRSCLAEWVEHSSIKPKEISTRWWSSMYRSETAFCHKLFSWWPGIGSWNAWFRMAIISTMREWSFVNCHEYALNKISTIYVALQMIQNVFWVEVCYSSLKLGLYSMRAYACIYARIPVHTPTVGTAVYTSVAGCAQRIGGHTPTVAVKVQTCWTFKASADQRRHSSKSRKRSKVTEGRRVVLHRDVCGRIPTHTLACLYFYPRRNLRYAVAMRRQMQAWTSVQAADAHGV